MIVTNYISTACNQLPHTVDWGRNNLICYASNHIIVIYDPNTNKYGSALSTLHVHSDRVNVVHWIKPSFPKPETEFISASSDGTAIIWNASNLITGSFKATDILRINEPTNICDAIYFSSNPSDLLICTGSINGDFRLWLRVGEQEIEPTQILNFSKKLPITARLALLTSKSEECPNPLLILAMEDSTILLYSTTVNIDKSNQK
jgi:WD40 repeat protein